MATKEEIWGPADEFGMHPQAARDRVAMCQQYGLTPDQEDLDCIARDDARKGK